MMISEKSAIKFRHEIKYIINKADTLLLRNRLHKLFQQDPNTDSRGYYRVSSLYFDTPYDKAYTQKIDGVNKREKFRLRYYNTDISFIRLEKKIKVNGLCSKYNAKLTIEQTKKLLSGNIGFLLDSADPLFIELYSKMKGQQLMPKTVVTYDREAFLYKPGNVRITIDSNLRSGLTKKDFLNINMYHAPVNDGQVILEVKYDNFLPDIVAMVVQIPNRQAGAYSKYTTCRKFD